MCWVVDAHRSFLSGCEQMPNRAVVSPTPSLCCCPVCLWSWAAEGPEKGLDWPRLKAPMWVSSGSAPPSPSSPQSQPCPGQSGLSCRKRWPEPVRLKAGSKPQLVAAQTEAGWWEVSGKDRWMKGEGREMWAAEERTEPLLSVYSHLHRQFLSLEHKLPTQTGNLPVPTAPHTVSDVRMIALPS